MTNEHGTRARRKGPRPKHVPLRTCVVCRRKEAKRGFVRIVRTPAGAVTIDLSGKANGRGAYLCDDPACWRRAAEGTMLDRALKTELGHEAREELRHYAQDHFRPDASDADAPAEP